MDDKIKEVVYRVLKGYTKTKMYNSIDIKLLTDLVISKKHNYNQTKGNFNGYFGTLTKSYMLKLYDEDVKRLKLVYEREEKINKILND